MQATNTPLVDQQQSLAALPRYSTMRHGSTLVRLASEYPPRAFLSPVLTWRELDPDRARVTLQVSDLKIDAVFEFEEAAQSCSIFATRPMAERGKFH